MTIIVGIGALTITDVVNVARHDTPIILDPAALAEVAKTRQHIEELATEPTPVYGVSTGFGALARRHIPQELRTQLQRSLVRSHAAGSGPEVERDVIRALMLLRLSTLMTGRTGVRPVVVETYAALLNAGITPIVYEYGSLGCSGDLAPLAHCALALMGEGDVRLADGTKTPAADALAAAGITPLILAEKEGLALINGTDGMLGMLCLTLADLARCAANIRTLVADSGILATAHAEFQRNHVQDAYSIRCSPQVTGAVRDTADYATTVANRELAAAIDNPVVTLDGRVVSNGTFHGAPIAYVLDFLAIAVADLASISERRTDRFLDVARNRGLNAFLADDPGVDSGHMIAQYTQAGIVSELKRNATPASVDSIPSSAMQEDHVSMGWSAGRKLRRSIDGLARVLAIEILTAARAIDLRTTDDTNTPAPGTGAVVARLRETVAGPGTDRYLAPEIAEVVALVMDGSLVAAAEQAVGELH